MHQLKLKTKLSWVNLQRFGLWSYHCWQYFLLKYVILLFFIYILWSLKVNYILEGLMKDEEKYSYEYVFL